MLVDLDYAIPDIIPASRVLAEAHRLDLALFVAFEEASVCAAEGMIRQAEGTEVLRFLNDQKQDDERHLVLFRQRLDLTLAAARPNRASATEAMLLRVLQGGKVSDNTLRRDEIVGAVVVPPLRRFLERCKVAAESGTFLDALVLLDVVLKGMALPLYEYEALYWQPVDPFLAELIRSAGEDERRHVTRAARMVCSDAVARRSELLELSQEAAVPLREAFRYYVRKLVGLFAVVAEQLPERYAEVDMVSTPRDQQVAVILAAAKEGLDQVLRQAGLDNDGHQQPLSHE